MFKETGVFRYEKDGKVYEEPVVDMTHQAGLIIVVVLNQEGKYTEYIYIPETHCWKTPDLKAKDDMYKDVPFKVLYCNFDMSYRNFVSNREWLTSLSNHDLTMLTLGGLADFSKQSTQSQDFLEKWLNQEYNKEYIQMHFPYLDCFKKMEIYNERTNN